MTFAEKIKLLFSNIWTFLAPFIRIFLTQAGQALAEIAMREVTSIALSMEDADGGAKREAAYSRIKEDLVARGIELGASAIYSAIEAAVQKLKLAEE
jgi:hypothetical protein